MWKTENEKKNKKNKKENEWSWEKENERDRDKQIDRQQIKVIGDGWEEKKCDRRTGNLTGNEKEKMKGIQNES